MILLNWVYALKYDIVYLGIRLKSKLLNVKIPESTITTSKNVAFIIFFILKNTRKNPCFKINRYIS